MEGKELIGADDHKVGTIVAERDGCAIVEHGHVFKSRHAIPQEFLHESDGVVRTTLVNAVVADSPKVDGDDLDVDGVRLYYGLIDVAVVDPDPQEQNAETDAVRHGIEPAPHKRMDTLGGAGGPSLDGPSGFDRMTNSADPAWTAAGLSDDDPQRDDALTRDEHLGDPPKR